MQWDYKKGEVEVYNIANKKHLGGHNAQNRDHRISNPVSRTLNGSWKVTTSKMLKVLTRYDKVINYISILNPPILTLFEYQMQMLPGYQAPGTNVQMY